MSEAFGSDYLTIEDEDGNEFELEVLNVFELDGQDYLAELFGSIDDDDELDKVYNYYMQEIFADEDEDSDGGAEE